MTKHEITPENAAEEFVESKFDVTQSTQDNLRARLRWFVDWCDTENIETLSELDGYALQQYTSHLRTADGLGKVTVENHVVTLRQLLRWGEKAEMVPHGLSEKVIIPDVSADERARDDMISHERAEAIKDYLAEFHYASLKHVIFSLTYHTGARRSAIHGLDIEDWHPEEQYISLRHRPDEGTRLKLGTDGERNVSITDNRLVTTLEDYISHQRDDVTDDYGRNPLFTSPQGRLHYQTLTKKIYTVTRPCFYADECTVDGREISECEAANYASKRSRCPDNVSMHPLRRSSITHALTEGVPKEIISGRASVSPEVLDLHYDARTIEERRENRREHLDDL